MRLDKSKREFFNKGMATLEKLKRSVNYIQNEKVIISGMKSRFLLSDVKVEAIIEKCTSNPIKNVLLTVSINGRKKSASIERGQLLTILNLNGLDEDEIKQPIRNLFEKETEISRREFQNQRLIQAKQNATKLGPLNWEELVLRVLNALSTGNYRYKVEEGVSFTLESNESQTTILFGHDPDNKSHVIIEIFSIRNPYIFSIPGYTAKDWLEKSKASSSYTEAWNIAFGKNNLKKTTIPNEIKEPMQFADLYEKRRKAILNSIELIAKTDRIEGYTPKGEITIVGTLETGAKKNIDLKIQRGIQSPEHCLLITASINGSSHELELQKSEIFSALEKTNLLDQKLIMKLKWLEEGVAPTMNNGKLELKKIK